MASGTAIREQSGLVWQSARFASVKVANVIKFEKLDDFEDLVDCPQLIIVRDTRFRMVTDETNMGLSTTIGTYCSEHDPWTFAVSCWMRYSVGRWLLPAEAG